MRRRVNRLYEVRPWSGSTARAVARAVPATRGVALPGRSRGLMVAAAIALLLPVAWAAAEASGAAALAVTLTLAVDVGAGLSWALLAIDPRRR